MWLWCYACEWRASVMTLTSINIFQLEGQNLYMATLGEMGDISNLCNIGWYEWVYFCQNTDSFPYQKEELCRWLGSTNNKINEMCQWILQQNVQIVPRRTLRWLRLEQCSATNDAKANKCASFDAAIKEDLGDSINLVPLKPTRVSMDTTNNFYYDEVDEDDYENVVPEADSVESRVKPINQQSVADLLINV